MLHPRFTPGASIDQTPSGWRLRIPTGRADAYRLAQLDDYTGLARGRFPCQPPVTLNLRARASAAHLPGTWGFGFWNDPFALSIGLRGGSWRLPALPNACWFFSASPENHLAFRDDTPGSGFLMQSFRSHKIPAALLAPGLPLLLSRAIARRMRGLARRLIREDGRLLDADPTAWHAYTLSWHPEGVLFYVDDKLTFETPVSPRGPLGLVLWIDNQYAAWRPDGSTGMGVLPLDDTAWLEIEDLRLEAP